MPPPPDRVMECMGALEAFLHDQPVRTPVLIKAALAHAPFEAIHPFFDGNGRLGRLLIPLLLHGEGALSEPILYLSLFFKTHRQSYYQHLQRVRVEGDWECWLRFFLEGIQETADQAIAVTRSLLDPVAADRRRIEGLGRPAGSALRVHELMRRRPVVSIADLADALELSRPMIAAALGRMRDLKIVREITGRQRHRLFVYGQYLIQAPRVAIEYVVAHELAHLLHRNHSSAFWLKLAETMPDWAKAKELLERWEGSQRAEMRGISSETVSVGCKLPSML